MSLDTSTLLQILILQTALLGSSTLLIARGEAAAYLRPWSIALLLQTISYFGFALRGVLPDWASIVVANVLLSLSYALMSRAIAHFNGTTLPRALLVGPAIALLLILPWLLERQDLRNITASIIMGGQLVLMLWALLRLGSPTQGRGQALLGTAIAASATVFLFRLTTATHAGLPAPGISTQYAGQTLLLVVAILSILAAAIGFIIMVLERTHRLATERSNVLSAILDSVSETIAMLHRDGTLLQINASGAARFHSSPAELIGKHLSQLMPTKVAGPRLQMIEQVASTGQSAQLSDHRGNRRYQMNFFPVKGTQDRVVVYAADITQASQAEEHLSFLNHRSQLLLELPRLADTLNEAKLMQRALEMAEELTGSVISFIHFVNQDEESIELIAWSRRTLESYCHAAFDRHYPISQAGIWAEPIRLRGPVIFNDYASATGKRGLPEGHAALHRLITLPVMENDKVVMLAGIGNKETDYTTQDVETLQLLANDVWRLVQRKQSLQQIARFSRLIEHSLSEIYSVDAETLTFVDANRGALKNTGYSIDELRQMTQLDITPDIDRQQLDEILARLRRRETELVRLSTNHLRKNGSRYPVEIHFELTEDTHPVLVAVARDISERLTAEHDLMQALQVVEASPVVSFRWRAEQDWPVAYVSSNVVRWGYSVEQIKAGKPAYAELIHPEDCARVAEEVARNTALHSDSFTQQYRIQAADGRYFWVDDHTRIQRRADGEVECYEGVVTDIDARKQTELELATNLARQRELNRKLEDAHSQLLQSEKMASIGQLAAGVAHELNNPIGFVHSNLGTLESYLNDIFQITETCDRAAASTVNPTEYEDYQAIKQRLDFDYIKTDIVQLVAESKDGLARVKKIVQDLKDFSRPGESQWQWADLHQGIDSTLNIVWNELKYKCTVVKHYAPDLPLVHCLLSQLNQVFINLLINAAHAIKDKGEITITTENIGGDTVRITISDTGTGIPPENLKRIFDPFFTTKPIGQGTGLGLSIAWGIIGKHHGSIAVDSILGQGTTFTIILPVQSPLNETVNGTSNPAQR